jgi:hypothetical protein
MRCAEPTKLHRKSEIWGTRPSFALKQIQRRLIRCSVEIFCEGCGEKVVAGWIGSLCEESNGGMELQVVGVSKDVAYGAADNSVDLGRTVAQTVAQDGVMEICPCLVEAGYGKALSHRARAQAFQLRKHEPHPVRALLSCSKLRAYLCETGGLRIDETLQMIRIVHCHSEHYDR